MRTFDVVLPRNPAFCVTLQIPSSKSLLLFTSLTESIAFSPRASTSPFAGPSQSSNTLPTRTWPSPNTTGDSLSMRSFHSAQLTQSPSEPQSLSRSVSTPATQPFGPPHPPQRSIVDKPASSHRSSEEASYSPAGGAWEGRVGEDILVDAPINRFQSHGPRNQDSDKLRQCDLKIFEIVNERYSIPTRRIAIRSCENEQHCVSYCKTRLFVDMVQTRIMLIARE